MEVCPLPILHHVVLLAFTHSSFLFFRNLQTPSNPNPKLQASLLRVAIMVARELQNDLKEEFYTEV